MGSQLESVSLYFNRKSVVRFRENSRHYILILRVIIYYKLTAAERMPVRDWEKLAAKGRKLFYGRGFLPVAFVVQ